MGASQPNLGQGGGQAIESAYTLAASLSGLTGASDIKDIRRSLFYQYSLKRVLRASTVHGTCANLTVSTRAWGRQSVPARLR